MDGCVKLVGDFLSLISIIYIHAAVAPPDLKYSYLTDLYTQKTRKSSTLCLSLVFLPLADFSSLLSLIHLGSGQLDSPPFECRTNIIISSLSLSASLIKTWSRVAACLPYFQAEDSLQNFMKWIAVSCGSLLKRFCDRFGWRSCHLHWEGGSCQVREFKEKHFTKHHWQAAAQHC